ncbi:cytochrome b [Serratia sp. NA_112.1]|uniref:cytochrome b n=1 Tax=unclassified Serratia (in: enterobacteria) TaxID=2647522 RepID=UPI004046FB00
MQHQTETIGIRTRYDLFSRLLHWIIAVAMFYVMIVGYSLHFMPNERIFTFFSETNMSLALVLTPLMMARFLWRFFRPSVPYGEMLKGHGKGLVHLLHEVFYLLIFVVLISGFLMLEKGFQVFGVIDFPRPVDSLEVNRFFFVIHRCSCVALAGMIVLHVAAVIKHHYFEKNAILHRML